MKLLLLSCIAFVLLSCASQSNTNTLVLDYDDFGPQVIAHEIIGMQWWQWQNHGESRPTFYDIKVVVYNNLSLESVKMLYPVNEARREDYRYVSYKTAINYLDAKISDNVMPVVSERLTTTKSRIVNQLAK